MGGRPGNRRALRLYPRLGTCEVCGVAPATDRHHKDGDPGNNARDNLAFVCARCHHVTLHDCWGNSTKIAQTHCAHGHEYTPKNTGVSHGRRRCLTCHRERERARYASRSGSAAPATAPGP